MVRTFTDLDQLRAAPGEELGPGEVRADGAATPACIAETPMLPT